MNWKYEVKVEGKFAGNSVVYATQNEADAGARELLSRWYVPTGYRTVETSAEVNHKFVLGRTVSV